MRKLACSILFSICFSQLSHAEEVAPANPPSMDKLSYGLDATYRFDARAYINEHNIQYTHKFSDDFKISAQGDFYSSYYMNAVERDAKDGGLKERYLRLKFVHAPIWDILGFKTGWEFRYHLPVDETQEKAGSFGMISPRLNLTRTFNSHFNMTIIPKSYIDLNRRGYQKYGSNKSNELAGIGIEILPQWVITPVLTLTYDPELVITAQGANPQNKKITYLNYYDHDVELMYTFKSLGNLGVGLLWRMDYFFFGNGHLSDAPNNEAFKGIRNRGGLRILKAWDI